MAVTNRERVGRALELLNSGLWPFVNREMAARNGKDWTREFLVGSLPGQEKQLRDCSLLLKVIWDHWQDVFNRKLSQSHRTLVSELRDTRNRWAHQEAFSTDDAYRAIDSTQRLLQAIAADESTEADKQKDELLRVRFEEQSRTAVKKVAASAIDGQPLQGLSAWRQVVTPHPDVASGRFVQAEFAADLDQVHRKQGSEEYRDPRAFYQRTVITEGLKWLLENALLRLSKKGGEPVIELQTSFGGGKTHTLLALYHMFSGTNAGEMTGIEQIVSASGVERIPKVFRAVLVGSKISPGQPHVKPDGTVVRTLWGELAYQLGGKDAYKLVAGADETATNPGDALIQLFSTYAPCLVLIDEWVAYARQLYGVSGLPAGTFDTQFTFAQALTEAALAVPGVMVVVSLPASEIDGSTRSEIEVGGEAGREVLVKLNHVLSRVQSPWRPATAEESFAIVQRRLFTPMTTKEQHHARDAVVSAFSNFYKTQSSEFPSECKEASYGERLKAAYPIHPELFDRLYKDWSTLEKFQRTRGVLRLMAAVIHALWERQDGNLLILPGTVPIDDPRVQPELTRYLDDNWPPVIDTDVDGHTSLPMKLDRANPNLGKVAACRRVARTIYLGSAPTLNSAHRGIEEHQIKLGCAQPGESPALFGDALRRLSENATYLYAAGKRYWYSPQPSVTKLAHDRAEQLSSQDVDAEIVRRLRSQQNERGDFEAIHVAPSSGSDVPDEATARLVILGPEYPHAIRDEASTARKRAIEILDQRGNSPRRFRNMLVFLTAERSRLEELSRATRLYLAWDSIEKEKVQQNLDPFQQAQVDRHRSETNVTVEQRLREAYGLVLVPTQTELKGPIKWEELRVSNGAPLAIRVAKKLREQELLLTVMAGTYLRSQCLDRVPLWRGDSVEVKQLWDDFAQYIYLPRLQNESVLSRAIEDGVSLISWQIETFGVADSYENNSKRYLGLRAGASPSGALRPSSLLVKPDVALRQLSADLSALAPTGSAASDGLTGGLASAGEKGASLNSHSVAPSEGIHALRRFHGSVKLDDLRVGTQAGQVAKEIIQHLSSLVGAKVDVTLEISATVAGGIPENIIRTVSENCAALKFESSGFEEE